jgi:hypothetical protein
MKRRIAWLIPVFLLCSLPAFAVEPRSPGIVTGAVAVGSSPEYLEAWRRPPEKGNPPRVPVVTEFAIGETAYVGFIVTGLLPDDAGRGNVTVDLKLIKPDGSFMFDEEACARINGPVSKEPGFYLAEPALDIVFEPGDPTGKYSLVVIYHDLVSKKAALFELGLTVLDKRPN